MKNPMKRRLEALEVKSDFGHKPSMLAYFDGPPEGNEKEVAAATVAAETNGQELWAIFFIPPQKQFSMPTAIKRAG
jgi:hypothetical protein